MTDQPIESVEELSFWDRHRFLLMIALAIIAAGILVSIALAVYSSSGAEQLDLSRPGYREAIKNNPVPDDEFAAYPSTGAVNAKTVSQFQALYDKQASSAKAVDAFGGDPLDPTTLGIGPSS